MEFTVKRSDLIEELGLVTGIVDKRPLMTILGYVLLETEADRLLITGRGKDISLRCCCPCNSAARGSIAIPPKKLMDIIRLLPESEILFRIVGNSSLEIRHEKSYFRISGLPKDQFPDIPVCEEYPISLPAPIFKEMILRTVFAASQQENERFVLGGAQVELHPGSVRMITSDGHRLVFAEKKDDIPGVSHEIRFLIPQRSLNELARMIDKHELIYFTRDDRHVYFKVGDRELISGLLGGAFPNYELIIPRDNTSVMTVNSALFNDCLRRSCVLAEESNIENQMMRKVKFRLRPGSLDIIASSITSGESQESLDVEYNGPFIETEFNAPYIVDFLSVVKTDQVDMFLKDEENPVLMKTKGEDLINYQYVLAVISVKENQSKP
jgi:DNA polymerase III subunit beta